MRKRLELSDPNSCINRAGDDEPVFVLRAHDPIATVAVRTWIEESMDRGFHTDRLDEARELLALMEQWRLDESRSHA